MKSDLDRLMAERGQDALLVVGSAAHNPPMYYLANGANVTGHSVLVKKRGEAPILFVSAMEREEAAVGRDPLRRAVADGRQIHAQPLTRAKSKRNVQPRR